MARVQEALKRLPAFPAKLFHRRFIKIAVDHPLFLFPALYEVAEVNIHRASFYIFDTSRPKMAVFAYGELVNHFGSASA